MAIETPNYLNDRELAAVQRFLEDETQLEAVRKVLLSGVYLDGKLEAGKPADPLKNFILARFSSQQAQLLPVEERGKQLDVIINAVSLVESGFQALEKLKPIKSPVEAKPNKAR